MKKSLLQKIAWAYAVAFFLIFLLNYAPGVHDENGLMFGLFKLDPIDDAVHIVSAIWAAIAGAISFRQSQIYFKVFGIFYFTDGILCTLVGQCLLDFTIFTYAHSATIIQSSNFMERLLPNIPHLVVGGFAFLLGFYLSKRPRFRQ